MEKKMSAASREESLRIVRARYPQANRAETDFNQRVRGAGYPPQIPDPRVEPVETFRLQRKQPKRENKKLLAA